MWHYLYFIVLIKVKDPTEFTGPESYVYAMVKVGCVSFNVLFMIVNGQKSLATKIIKDEYTIGRKNLMGAVIHPFLSPPVGISF